MATSFTDAQFQALLAAISAAAQPAPQIAIQTVHVKPDKYKAEKGVDLNCFVSQCEAYWITSSITDEKTRVLTALGLMQEKASHWAITITDHMAANNGDLPTNVDTWAKLKAELTKHFGDATPKDTAFLELEKLCNLEGKEKNNRDVGTYITEFQTYTARIPGLSDEDKELRFTKGLPTHIY